MSTRTYDWNSNYPTPDCVNRCLMEGCDHTLYEKDNPQVDEDDAMTSIDGREAIEAMLRKEFIATYRELCKSYGLYLFPGDDGNIEINRIWGGKWNEDMLEFMPGIDTFAMRVKELEERDARTSNFLSFICSNCGMNEIDEPDVNSFCQPCMSIVRQHCDRCGELKPVAPGTKYLCEACVYHTT